VLSLVVGVKNKRSRVRLPFHRMNRPDADLHFRCQGRISENVVTLPRGARRFSAIVRYRPFQEALDILRSSGCIAYCRRDVCNDSRPPSAPLLNSRTAFVSGKRCNEFKICCPKVRPVGQNIGAGRMDRVNQGAKDILRISLTTSFVLVALLLLLFGKNLITMFTTTEEIIRLGVRQIRILAAGYVAMAVSRDTWPWRSPRSSEASCAEPATPCRPCGLRCSPLS